jgi:hypothetical protein
MAADIKLLIETTRELTETAKLIMQDSKTLIEHSRELIRCAKQIRALKYSYVKRSEIVHSKSTSIRNPVG